LKIKQQHFENQTTIRFIKNFQKNNKTWIFEADSVKPDIFLNQESLQNQMKDLKTRQCGKHPFIQNLICQFDRLTRFFKFFKVRSVRFWWIKLFWREKLEPLNEPQVNTKRKTKLIVWWRVLHELFDLQWNCRINSASKKQHQATLWFVLRKHHQMWHSYQKSHFQYDDLPNFRRSLENFPVQLFIIQTFLGKEANIDAKNHHSDAKEQILMPRNIILIPENRYWSKETSFWFHRANIDARVQILIQRNIILIPETNNIKCRTDSLIGFPKAPSNLTFLSKNSMSESDDDLSNFQRLLWIFECWKISSPSLYN